LQGGYKLKAKKKPGTSILSSSNMEEHRTSSLEKNPIQLSKI